MESVRSRLRRALLQDASSLVEYQSIPEFSLAGFFLRLRLVCPLAPPVLLPPPFKTAISLSLYLSLHAQIPFGYAFRFAILVE